MAAIRLVDSERSETADAPVESVHPVDVAAAISRFGRVGSTESDGFPVVSKEPVIVGTAGNAGEVPGLVQPSTGELLREEREQRFGVRADAFERQVRPRGTDVRDSRRRFVRREVAFQVEIRPVGGESRFAEGFPEGVELRRHARQKLTGVTAESESGDAPCRHVPLDRGEQFRSEMGVVIRIVGEQADPPHGSVREVRNGFRESFSEHEGDEFVVLEPAPRRHVHPVERREDVL
ncbi:hypothetical protein A4G99_22000 [Haladaptatus sp. R4]|nr:hypothetical protein A4G99_22000 [Haladaptatus sp. R4]